MQSRRNGNVVFYFTSFILWIVVILPLSGLSATYLLASEAAVVSSLDNDEAFSPPDKAATLRFFYLCKPQGNLELMPCQSNTGRGLLAAAHTVESFRREQGEAAVFLTGDLFNHKARHGDIYQGLVADLEDRVVDRTYEAMKVTVALPGLDDLLIGISPLKTRLTRCGLKPVISNLVRKEGGELVFPDRYVFESGGLKIGVVGLIGEKIFHVERSDPSSGKRPETRMIPITEILEEEGKTGVYEVLDPLDTARRIAAELKSNDDVDLVVGLSYLTLRRGLKIMNTTEVDVILGNNMCKKDGYRLKEQGIRCSTRHSVQNLGYLELTFSGDPNAVLGDRTALEAKENQLKELREELEELTTRYGTTDGTKLKRLAQGTKDAARYDELKLQAADLRALILQSSADSKADYALNRFLSLPGFFSPAESGIGKVLGDYLDALGTIALGREDEIAMEITSLVDQGIFLSDQTTCRSCHKRQYEHWTKTSHARAFTSVRKLGCENMASCFACHTTGYRCQGGFFLPPPPEGNGAILCEACHGFLGDHLKDFLIPPQNRFKENMGATKKLCAFCHDEAHHPDFSTEEAFARIKCPSIDFSESHIVDLYKRADAALDAIEEQKGNLSGDQCVRRAIYRKRLGKSNADVIPILFRGADLEPDNIDLVKFLYPILLSENRSGEALELLESYIEKVPGDAAINKEIIRLLLLSQDKKIRDPSRAREYISWYLENLSDKEVEVYLLLVNADMQLSLYDEARTVLDQLDVLKPNEKNKARIQMLRKQLDRLQGR